MPDIDALVIFGATGDLAKLETFPALVAPKMTSASMSGIAFTS